MIQNDLQRPALTGIENQIESFGIESRIGERRNRVGRSWISSQPVELAHLIVPDLLEVGVIDTAAPRPYLDQIRGIILAECFEQARTATLPIGLEEIGLGLDIAIKISPPCSPSFVRQFVPLITGRTVLFLTETLPSADYPLSLSGALHRRLFAMRQADHLQLSKWHAVPPKHVRQSIASRVLGGLNADECPAAISPECAACSMCRGRSADWASLLTARHPSTAVAAATTREWQAHSASG